MNQITLNLSIEPHDAMKAHSNTYGEMNIPFIPENFNDREIDLLGFHKMYEGQILLKDLGDNFKSAHLSYPRVKYAFKTGSIDEIHDYLTIVEKTIEERIQDHNIEVQKLIHEFIDLDFDACTSRPYGYYDINPPVTIGDETIDKVTISISKIAEYPLERVMNENSMDNEKTKELRKRIPEAVEKLKILCKEANEEKVKIAIEELTKKHEEKLKAEEFKREKELQAQRKIDALKAYVASILEKTQQDIALERLKAGMMKQPEMYMHIEQYILSYLDKPFLETFRDFKVDLSEVMEDDEQIHEYDIQKSEDCTDYHWTALKRASQALQALPKDSYTVELQTIAYEFDTDVDYVSEGEAIGLGYTTRIIRIQLKTGVDFFTIDKFIRLN